MSTQEHSLVELIAQRNELDALISERQRVERTNAIGQAAHLINIYNIRSDELFGKAAPKKAGKSVSAPKYRNKATGETWTGRGRAPNWLKELSDEQRAEFLVGADAA